MIEESEPPPDEDLRVLIRSKRSCLVANGGALVSLRRAMINADDLRLLREAVDELEATRPSGLVLVAAYRLDRRFPIQTGLDADLSMFVDTLRALDRRLLAIASVLEFGGVRAATMRVVSRTVWTLARPESKLRSFDRIVDAATWIAPYAREVGAPSDVASYLRAYREVERQLKLLDEEDDRDTRSVAPPADG